MLWYFSLTKVVDRSTDTAIHRAPLPWLKRVPTTTTLLFISECLHTRLLPHTVHSHNLDMGRWRNSRQAVTCAAVQMWLLKIQFVLWSPKYSCHAAECKLMFSTQWTPIYAHLLAGITMSSFRCFFGKEKNVRKYFDEAGWGAVDNSSPGTHWAPQMQRRNNVSEGDVPSWVDTECGRPSCACHYTDAFIHVPFFTSTLCCCCCRASPTPARFF